MRLVVTKIYRAFPELDRFSDEQCARFVAAAESGVWRRGLLGVVLVISGLAALVAAAAAGAATMEAFWVWHSSVLMWSMSALATGAAAFPCLGAGLFVRHWLMRRRIAYLLRTRGVCAACRYNLVGLPVGSDGKVTCPECSLATAVDRSLGELVIDGAGQARYVPDERAAREAAERAVRWRRFLVRAGWWSVGAAVLGAGIWGAVIVVQGVRREQDLRAQTAAATAARPGMAALKAQVKAGLAGAIAFGDEPGAGEGADAWTLVTEAAERLERMKADATPANPPKVGGMAIEATFAWLGFGQRPDALAEEVERGRLTRELTIKVLDACRTPELLAKLRAIPGARATILPMSASPGEPLLNAADGTATAAWRACMDIGSFQSGRMQLALDRGDDAEFGEALEGELFLARLANAQAWIMMAQDSYFCEYHATRAMRRALWTHAGPAFLEQMRGAVERQRFERDSRRMLETQRLLLLDLAAWAFSDRVRVEAGVKAPELLMYASASSAWGSNQELRLGTYVENTTTVNWAVDLLEGGGSDAEVWRPGGTGLVLMDAFLPQLQSVKRQANQAEMERAGMRLWLAIERFRADRGRAPGALAELAPSYLDAIANDPLWGRPFGYRRLEAPDAQGREYLLYATGPDKEDNGGREMPSGGETAEDVRAGWDYVINRRE